MKEIKILNSNLKLVEVPIDRDGRISFISTLKNQLRYQDVVLIGTSGFRSLEKIHDITGVTISKTPKETTAWVIKRTDEVYKDPEELDEKELTIILEFIYQYSSINIELTDLLVNTLGDYKLYKKWNNTYGPIDIKQFQRDVTNIIYHIEEFEPEPYILNNIPKTGKTYSVQNLLDDLISDKADILVDPELIGEYRKISLGVKFPDDVKKMIHEWQPVIGILGNKTRANLSLQYNLPVSVPIPKNPYISDTERKCFTITAICIVKDGELWTKCLGVRVSSKLAGKLKRLGLVKMPLLGENEYLINFSEIPVAKKTKISSYELAKLELRVMISNIALDYLEYKTENEGTKEKENDEEIFLRKLGIIKNQYYPSQSTSNSSVATYEVSELKAQFTAIPRTKKQREMAYRSGRLDHGLVNLINGKTKEEWLEEFKISQQELRATKFSFIMTRDMKFSDTKQNVNAVTVPLYLGGIVKQENCINVSWNFERKLVRYENR